MALSLSVQFATRAAHLPNRAQVRRWASAAYALAASQDATITIRYVDNAEGRALNRNFRGKDYATNVLTFADSPPDITLFRAKPESPSKKEERVSAPVHADIAICAPIITQEAKAQRKSVHAHHAHMVVHGMLHALGFDHENETDASEMETLEARVLQRFRINNPYE
jgi:probable rRNA maturation factor